MLTSMYIARGVHMLHGFGGLLADLPGKVWPVASHAHPFVPVQSRTRNRRD
jgi:hypothetical protein